MRLDLQSEILKNSRTFTISLRRHIRASPGPVLRAPCVIALCALLVTASSCTLMLAGSIVHKIVTEIKSKKTIPNTNQIAYNILAVDEASGERYMVDVYVSLRVSNEKNALLFCVERIFVSYRDEIHGLVVMEDLEGDGVLDGIRMENCEYGPPFPYNSLEYERRNSGKGLGPEDPWYAFVERDPSGEGNQTAVTRLNAAPFQDLHRRVAVPALQELDFRSPQRR